MSSGEHKVGDVSLSSYGLGAVAVIGATVVGWFARSILAPPDLVMLYLAAIMIVAVRSGRGPALFTSALSVAAFDFFFVPPFFTFAVDEIRNWLTFAMMFAVGVLLSGLTLRIRRQEERERLVGKRSSSPHGPTGSRVVRR